MLGDTKKTTSTTCQWGFGFVPVPRAGGCSTAPLPLARFADGAFHNQTEIADDFFTPALAPLAQVNRCRPPPLPSIRNPAPLCGMHADRPAFGVRVPYHPLETPPPRQYLQCENNSHRRLQTVIARVVPSPLLALLAPTKPNPHHSPKATTHFPDHRQTSASNGKAIQTRWPSFHCAPTGECSAPIKCNQECHLARTWLARGTQGLG